MTPPAGPGQRAVLRTHYAKAGDSPVAFLDETYHLDRDGRERFYVMAAVVVAARDRDPLRSALDDIVPSGWWHTSEQLRSEQGRADALRLLETLQAPEDACVIVDHAAVAATDDDDAQARHAALSRLLLALDRGEGQDEGRVGLAVAEEHRIRRVNNADRATRSSLLTTGRLTGPLGLVHASPGSEHLLWLPDLVCSAYRQERVRRDPGLLTPVRSLTTVIRLP